MAAGHVPYMPQVESILMRQDFSHISNCNFSSCFRYEIPLTAENINFQYATIEVHKQMRRKNQVHADFRNNDICPLTSFGYSGKEVPKEEQNTPRTCTLLSLNLDLAIDCL